MATAKKAPAGTHMRAERSNATLGCELTAALATIGGRWKLFIVYRLAGSPLHFATLRRSLSDVSAKVLGEQLYELQADGLVSREHMGPVPTPVRCTLTPHGQSVPSMADGIRRWGLAFRAVFAMPADSTADSRAACDYAAA